MMVIHGDKLRWLFWLRWKLFLRGFTRDKSRIIGAIFMIVFGLPIYTGIAIATFLGYRLLPAPANAEILFLVLTGVYLIWMVLPLLEFTVNEGLDVSKLTLFPLTRSELMVSLLFSTLLDIPMFGLILVFIAVIAGWAVSIPVALLTTLAVVICYAQVVGMSQLVLALLMRTLQSRRFRDLSIILIALFSSSCYIFQQIVLRGIGTGNFVANIEQARFSFYLQWLPPGMTARAIQQAALGNWGASLAWLVASLVAGVLILYLWALVLERSLSTPETGGAIRARREKIKADREAGALAHPRPVGRDKSGPYATPSTGTSFWLRLGSTQTFAITIKELKYFWRDPQLKAVLLSSLYIIVVFLIGPLFNPDASIGSVGTLTLTAPLAVFFSVFTLSYNTLGLERQSLTTLFLFPVEPRRILFGKNLAVAMMGTVELVVLVLASAFFSHAWNIVLPVLAVGLAGIAVVLGCGNITSVFLPQRMRQMQRGFQATGSSAGNPGCQRALMSMVMLLVAVVLLIPVALALFLPLIFHVQWVWVFAIPASLLYGLAFHQLVTRLVAPRMLARIPEILEVTTRE
jgi:ABC-2 type transport system permease protein